MANDRVRDAVIASITGDVLSNGKLNQPFEASSDLNLASDSVLNSAVSATAPHDAEPSRSSEVPGRAASVPGLASNTPGAQSSHSTSQAGTAAHTHISGESHTLLDQVSHALHEIGAPSQAGEFSATDSSFGVAAQISAPSLSAAQSADQYYSFAPSNSAPAAPEIHASLNLHNFSELHSGGDTPDGSGGGDPDGQLWAADDGVTGNDNPDGQGSDARLEHMDSDGQSSDWVDAYSITSTGAFISVGLDTAANLYFAEDNQDKFYVGHISTGANLTTTTIASTSDEDVTNSFVVDPANDTIFMDLDGGDYTADGGDIIKITYNPSTGTISSPYNPSTFAINLNDVLVDSTSSSGVYQDGRAFALSADGSTLYYVDDDDDNPGGAFSADTNGIYKISTSGNVGQGTATTPVLLSSQSQFPVNDSNGYITGIAVNSAQGLIYFTTDASGEGVNTGEDAIWYMPIAGGTATKMTLPGGVTLDYAAFFSNGIAFDPHTVSGSAGTLYVTDTERDAVIQLVLNSAGTGFSSGNNDFYTTDTNSGDGASTYALTWGALANESSLTGTSTVITQGGSAVTLLTSTPTITNPEGSYISNLEGYTIRVIGGTAGNGSSFGVTSGAIASGTGVGGDEIFINGQQSGSLDGGLVTVSWDNSTQTLTLTGDVSETEYQTLLSEVTFVENASTDTTSGSHPTRVIDFIANDGITVDHPTTTDPNEQTITITLDRAPTVVTESVTAVESNTVTGTSGTGGTGGLDGDSDLDGDSLSISAITGGTLGTALAGTYGSLTLNANGSYSYVASNTSAINAAATGSHPIDSFTYTVSDGDGGTTLQTINFSIDRPPTVVTENVSLLESGSASGTFGTSGTGALAGDSDKDGDSVSILSITGGTLGTALAGTYGSLTLNANGSYIYNASNTSAINSAATGSHPVDAFTYTVSDGHGGTTLQTIDFSIDRAPTVVTENVSAVESGSASGTAGTGGTGGLDGDSDPDGDSLTISAITGGTLGTALAGTYGSLTLNANGTYTYNASNTSAINSAATGSHPVDSFTYTVSDGHGGTTLQTIDISIDRAPTVVTESASVLESSSASGTAGIGGTGGLDGDSDADGDSLTITAITGGTLGTALAGTYGSLTLSANGTYTYNATNTSAIDSAATGSHPVDSFTYTVSDGHGGTTLQTINFTIDRAPTVVTENVSVLASGSASGTSGIAGTGGLDGDSDKDGDSLTITAITGGTLGTALAGTYGSLTLNANGSYTYNASNTSAINSAATGSHPVDSFTYTVSDGHGGTTLQTIDFSIDRAPVGNNDDITVFAGASATTSTYGTGALSVDTDPDGDTLTVTAISGGTVGTALAGTYGSLTLNANGTYTYNASNSTAINAQPDNAVLTDTFTYTLSDGHGGTTTAELVVTVDQAPTVSSLTALTTSSANFSTAHTVTFTLDVGKDVTVAGGTTLSLSDGGTATYVSGSGTQTLTFTYSATDAPGSLTVSGISAGSIADAAGNGISIAGTAVSTYTDAVTDSAANVSADFNSLESAVSHISSITLNDGGTPNLDLTAAQALDDTTLIGKIVSSYNLVINDSSTNVASNIDGLESDAANISSIVLNDGGTPTLTITQTQETNDHTILTKIQGPYDLHVTGVTGQSYSSYTVDVNASNTITEAVYFNNDSSQTIVGLVSGLTLAGTANVNTFDLQSAPDVTVNGSGTTDYYYFGSALTASDTVNGGSGANNIVILNGDYSAGLTLGASTFSGVQELIFDSGHSYNITANAATVGSGDTLAVYATSLGSGDSLTFNGSAVTNGNFTFYLGAGTNTITDGNGNDTIYGGTGTDAITLGSGTDTVAFTTGFSVSDSITGGGGTSTLVLNGDYSSGLTFTATTISGVNEIELIGGHSYNITTAAANDTSGHSLEINGQGLVSTDTLTFNGSANAGAFDIYAGAGTNNITGGTGADTIWAAGTDTFLYTASNDVTSGTVYDTIHNINFSNDTFDFSFAVTGVQAAITTGGLSLSTFQANLTHDLSTLGAHDAVLFTASSGGLSGETFLIINDTGTVGYHTGDDLVIRIEGTTGTLTTSDFTST